jgi:hypothetical protein
VPSHIATPSTSSSIGIARNRAGRSIALWFSDTGPILKVDNLHPGQSIFVSVPFGVSHMKLRTAASSVLTSHLAFAV